MAGLLVMTLAMLPIGMTSSLQQLFTLICLFYIGSIIAEPARETLGASLADAGRAAAIWLQPPGARLWRRAGICRRRLAV